MQIPQLPASAPFSPAQRSYLNGFLAGLLSATQDPGSLIHQTPPGAAPHSSGPNDALMEAEEELLWHDPALTLEDRMALANGKPFARRLMAAMAQLDCGSCGYVCQSYAEAIASGQDKDVSKCTPGGKETRNKIKELLASRPAEEGASPSPHPPAVAAPPSEGVTPEGTGHPIPQFDRENPFPAPVLENRRLTGEGSAKDVRFLSLGLRGSGLHYDAGDALGVFPENCPELVEAVLTLLEATGEEPVRSPEGRTIPARIALQAAYGVNRASDEFLEALSGLTANDADRGMLRQLAATDADSFLHGRDVVDVLREFPSARPQNGAELNFLLSKLTPLRPRLYSISSSQLAFPHEVHLTVGLVSYAGAAGERIYKGVASGFLSERCRRGQKVGIFVQKSHGFHVPTEPDADLLMVGPGTGIAPFRAFLQERAAREHQGRNWLFFGDQRQQSDFLYREEMELYRQKGILSRLDLAFSRDQSQKIYVQHRMMENGPEIWRWLDSGARFMVCGDASRMAKDVDNTLRAIVQQHGGKSEDNAREYLQSMTKAGRYCRDVY